MTIALDQGAVDQQASHLERPKRVGIPKEVTPGECRIAATPKTVKKLQSLGFDVLIEQGAGERAEFSDHAYREAGCEVIANAIELWQQADIVLKVQPPSHNHELNCHETELAHDGQTLISFLWPAQNADLINQLAAKQVTALAMDSVPRISRAQKMDALSSMANVAGYRAVIEAANNFGRFFTGQITAAGKVPPAKVLVIGAGVAGLAAIGAAKSLGAIVRAFDTRPVVKEQVESMGAEFLELNFAEDGTGTGGYAKVMSKEFIEAEMALFAEQAKEVDIIITTALIPGKKAPLLVTKDTVELMKPGSVIVDMAAEQGGNCEVSRAGEVYRHQGVTIVGLTDLASRMAGQSSQLYGMNLYHLLNDMGGSDGYTVNVDDEVVRGALVSHEGQVTWPAPKPEKPAPPKVEAKGEESTEVEEVAAAPKFSLPWQWIGVAFAALALIGIGIGAPSSFLSHFTVFILACFVGWQVIWNVSPSLHTPLMSVTNAISGIIIIGGMLQISGKPMSPTVILGAIAIFIGTINIAGGFLVTQRMLKMFRK
ncbi:Re/Si-specific NAD(P)(+) transhydrogenase subunit alpha [Leptolyngbyaceae cyanobacterium CCMR0082]|uniref:NAD(P) transhydrogenase subunit alpha n=2 Tax=Adonisia turfae TaxID=2950184 RepID=A0A6M0S948_9CYAN|nr:Re/Si-specific NAD(P)(+) transhydrogenase subunit alpha [Adonisia turfae]NEZ54715.1 Re/Si-specific NAD(P)(+) transhydrogenase subunit alpha [Adonisia turfae CCMR0081]NEZ65005.1 Re/Si-specific NAD(P)(+) transhydrogenase subunit alpha [Adonisia turfae CCMR0082]